jgi:hypothetical protein
MLKALLPVRSAGWIFRFPAISVRALGEQMPNRLTRVRTGTLLAGSLALVALLGGMHAACAYSHQVLYDFCSSAKCADGARPIGRLTMDANGNLYGATTRGGTGATGKNSGYGTVFELVKNGSTYSYRVLWRYSGGADGAVPNGALVLDGERIFGTARYGGKYNQGTAFELHPVTVLNRTVWKIAILHAFCKKSGCSDGSEPLAGLAYYGMDAGTPYSDDAPLYGTASGGGGYNGGVIFTLSGTTHAYSVLAKLGRPDQRSRTTSTPAGELAVAADGTLYGGALNGKNGAGADGAKLFLLKPQSKSPVIFMDLCGSDPLRCWGTNPSAALDSNGTSVWFTAATTGYKTECASHNTFEGILGEVSDPSDPNSSQTAYEICGPKFGAPSGKAILNGTYGTTADGGTTNEGVVYGRVFNAITTVHDFCLQPNCVDGAHPTGGVIVGVGDNLYGTTTDGGANGAGTIYVTTEH